MRATRTILLVLLMSHSMPGHAQARDAVYSRVQDWMWFAAGAAAGFLLHEGGHVAFDLVSGNEPHLKPVRLGPLPFFAISPQAIRSPGQLYGASMMGFFAEAVYTELIFASYPDLMHRHRPVAEGLLAFHCALDLGYALTGVLQIGPRESDVNSMARAAKVSPQAIGLMLVLPLVFDVLRYIKPELLRGNLWLSAVSRVLMFRAPLVL